MQRPSAAASPQLADGEAKKQGNTLILQNKGTFEPSTLLLEKEEKKDDQGMIMKPVGRAGSNIANENATPTNAIPKLELPLPNKDAVDNALNSPEGAKMAWNPLEEVDSALLSALCDARERKALFRLEQVMLDFMKDKSSGSMEVGGAFNSIVLNQSSSGGSYINSGETSDGQTISQQGLQDLQYQNQRGLKQTSFQRLILHRLADRFNIIREQINYTNNIAGNERGLVDVGSTNVGQPPSFSPGLIRLVKTSESCIPPHLLIDIDLLLLVNYKNPRARNYGGGSNITNNCNIVHSIGNFEDGAKNVTESMASVTLESSTVGTSSGGNKKAKKKMVIMKRNSSSESGSNADGKGKGKQKGKSRRKKLEEREKAYEEARARIFGINNESSGNENNGGGDDNDEKGETLPVPQSADSQDNGATPMTSCHSSFSLDNDVTPPTSAVRESIVPSQLISATAPSTARSSPSSPEPQGSDQEPASPPGTAAEIESSRQPSSSIVTPSVPAAATSGAVFKAVYRNRQQEENDPDFKRRSDVRPAYTPYVASPYGAPVGYVNPALNQQSPPQMMSMHVQQQQQAHQPHFYHGPQSTQQFPTPQDAASYASNVGNNPPPQWTAAPARGYYPSSQQQGQQEKHPQAWQPRPSSNQIQPNMNISLSNQPTKVLWGPAAQANGGETERAAPRTSSEGRMQMSSKEGAAVYKPEDFPALG